MYYNRTLSSEFEDLLKIGELNWLIDYVKDREDLDILIGKNNKIEYCSIYRGTTRILLIEKAISKNSKFKIKASAKYKIIAPDIFSGNICDVTKDNLEKLRSIVAEDCRFDRYYNNKKEGWYQNMYARKYGILSHAGSEFVVVDKESVVGYDSEKEQDEQFKPLQESYKIIRQNLSNSNPFRFGALEKKALGSELDLLALDKNGNILLLELKHGSNTSGIYLAPFQIGLYYDVFNKLDKKILYDAVFEMLKQKQRLGLISPEWKIPNKIGEIKALLVIGNFNKASSSLTKYYEVISFINQENPKLAKDIEIVKI